MRLRRWILISVFLLGLWVLLSNSTVHAQQVQSATGQSASNPSPSAYVGTDTCKTCHDDIYNKHFEGTRHFALLKEGKHGWRTVTGRAPLTSMGAGTSARSSASRLSRASRRAHVASVVMEPAKSRLTSASRPMAIATSDASTATRPITVRKPQYCWLRNSRELCYGCHASARADFGRLYHHESMKDSSSAATATILTALPTCVRSAPCQVETRFATSATPTNRGRSSTSMSQ